MTNTATALTAFWSSFGLPAYSTGTVPDDVQLPYITFSLVESECLDPTSHYVQVWYRDTSNSAALAIVDAIKDAIGVCKILPCTGGYVVIRPSTPYVQMMTDQNPENRYAYINLQINCYHK